MKVRARCPQYHSIKAVNENSDKNGIKTHSQDMKAFGQLDKASKKTTSKHPLRAHRERGKKRNRKRKHRKNKNKKKKNKKKHGKRGSRNRRFGRSFLAEQPDTSSVAADWPNQVNTRAHAQLTLLLHSRQIKRVARPTACNYERCHVLFRGLICLMNDTNYDT